MHTRLGGVVLAAAIPLAALVVDPAGWFPFGPSKWLVVSTLVPAGAALLLWRRPVRVAPSTLIALGALIGWLSIAALVGHDQLYAWVGTPERHFGVVTWLLCALALLAGHAFETRRDDDVLAVALAIAAVGAGGFATAQALGFEPSVFAVTPGRLSATMGSAAYLGALSALLLPAAIGIALDRSLGRRVRGIAGVAILPATIALLGAGARAAWVGVAAATIVLAVVHRHRLRRGGRRVVLALALGALVLVAVVLVSPVGDRLSSTTNADEAGGRSRLDEWRVATRVIAAHPLTGVGPEGYRIAFAEGVDDHYEETYGREPLPDRAHSGPLDVALAGGWPALMAWAAVIGLMVSASVRALRQETPWLVGLGTALVAHFAGQLLLFPIAELEPIAWLLGGVVLASSAVDRGPTRVSPRPAVAVVGALAFVAVVAGGRDIAADRNANDAATALQTGATHDAVASASAAVDARPDEVRLHLLLAQSLEADRQGTIPALAAVQDALDISPHDPIALRLRAELLVDRANSTHLPADVNAARVEIDQLVARDPHNATLVRLAGIAARLAADAPSAEASFLRAERLAPHDARPSVALAELYLDTGRPRDALAAARRAVGRAPDDREAQAVLQRAEAAG